MKLMELKLEHVDADSNDFHKSEKLDTRRPRLTLEHLGKLRKMREIRAMEMEDRRKFYTKIYQRPTAQM